MHLFLSSVRCEHMATHSSICFDGGLLKDNMHKHLFLRRTTRRAARARQAITPITMPATAPPAIPLFISIY